MTDYYLRTLDEPAMVAALEVLPGDTTVDVLGVVYRVIDEDLGTVEAVPGFYANVRSAEPIEWPDSVESLQPLTPWRVFA